MDGMVGNPKPLWTCVDEHHVEDAGPQVGGLDRRDHRVKVG